MLLAHLSSYEWSGKTIVGFFQLVQFGGQRSAVVEYFDGNQRALEHLLLKDWDASYETMPYPPATGEYALYTVDDLLDYIDFAWEQVSMHQVLTVCLYVGEEGGGGGREEWGIRVCVFGLEMEDGYACVFVCICVFKDLHTICS